MSADVQTASSLDDIIDKEIKIDHDNFQKITEKNSEKNSGKKFEKRDIYIVNKINGQEIGQEIGIGHIVYTKTTIDVSQYNKNNSNIALKKTFINYVYLNNTKNDIQPKLINIEEIIDGDIDNNFYFKFKKDYSKPKNKIELLFIFNISKGVTLNFYDYFFKNDDMNYYITSGKCGSGNNKYYKNADDGNLFNAFQQIFNPGDIDIINTPLQNKFEELQDIVKNVYIDSKAHPDIREHYDIASEFTINNKKVNIDGFIDFINKNNNWWTIEDLKILSKYFNLNCNIIEFKENELINKLNKIDREIDNIDEEINDLKNKTLFNLFISKRFNKLNNDKSKKETEKINLEKEKKILESNNDSIPIKNISLNDSEGCILYPFLNENQMYPYTFCNLDGKNWYLKKHNCEIDYDLIKGGAETRYNQLKEKKPKRIDDDYDDDDVHVDDVHLDDGSDDYNRPTTDYEKYIQEMNLDYLLSPPNAGNMNIQKIENIEKFFAKNSFLIESKGEKYLFALVDTELVDKDDKDIVDLQFIIKIKDQITFKINSKESRSIYSFWKNIIIKNINKPLYKIVDKGLTYYVIPL